MFLFYLKKTKRLFNHAHIQSCVTHNIIYSKLFDTHNKNTTRDSSIAFYHFVNGVFFKRDAIRPCGFTMARFAHNRLDGMQIFQFWYANYTTCYNSLCVFITICFFVTKPNRHTRITNMHNFHRLRNSRIFLEGSNRKFNI